MEKILLVEDDKHTRDLYRLFLKEAGYQVEIAEDGKTGLSKAIQGGYDLILLDIILPEIDGLKFLEEFKKVSPRPKSKVVMLTVLDQDDYLKKAIDLGAAGYLVKSILSPDEVLAMVKGFLKDKP
ncbi:MAG TPA: response regulator [Candidatus Bathyarchaeia archaeon]|nr:response regulator [Candidatus Bathyarchaeia archaeon]